MSGFLSYAKIGSEGLNNALHAPPKAAGSHEEGNPRNSYQAMNTLKAKTQAEVFNEGYYLRAEGSNYRNYNWIPEATIPLASTIKKLMGMSDGDKVLDVGAARGYLVKAMRIIGLEAHGFDISEWAVSNCDPDVQSYMGLTYDKTPMSFDFITAKDVFEHVPKDQLREMLRDMFVMMRKAMLIIVPLTEVDGCEYLCPKDEMDITHVNRWTLPTWLKFLENIDRRMVVSGGYWVPGIKQANTAWDGSCGFITIRRM